jgi:hypothetical protein
VEGRSRDDLCYQGGPGPRVLEGRVFGDATSGTSAEWYGGGQHPEPLGFWTRSIVKKARIPALPNVPDVAVNTTVLQEPPFVV